MAKLYTVYEVRYFYLAIIALAKTSQPVSEDEAKQLVRSELNRFNHNRTLKYNLPDRSWAYNQTPHNLLQELREYELLTLDNQAGQKYWQLTTEGWRIYELLKSPANNLRLRQEFAVLMLNHYPLFKEFLTRLNPSSSFSTTSQLITIPRLAEKKLGEFSSDHADQAISHVSSLVARLLQPYFSLSEELKARLEQYLSEQVKVSLGGKRKLATVLAIETNKFFLKYFFGSLFKNTVSYEVTRARCAYVGLANYCREAHPGGYLDLVYPTTSVIPANPRKQIQALTPVAQNLASEEETENPNDNQPGQVIEGFQLKANWQKVSFLGGELLIQRADESQADLDRFVHALKQAYQVLPRPTGYMEVADLRDWICLQLRWPDYLFDSYLKKFVQAQLHTSEEGILRVYLDNALDRNMPVPKRAPLELGNNLYNLVRVVNY